MKTRYINIFVLLSILSFFLSATACGNHGSSAKSPAPATVAGDSAAVRFHSDSSLIQTEYAEGFQVSTWRPGIRLVEIHDPQSSLSGSFKYAFVERGAETKGLDPAYAVIQVPVQKVICMTSLQLSNFIRLDAVDRVSGITSSRHLFNEEINARVKDGRIARIGIEGNFDNETIMAANPDLILISPFKRGGYETLKDVGIPLIPHLGYKEMTPLGQAEWIKFVGMLTGKEAEAVEIFKYISERYNELKALCADQTEKPMVFSGEMRGGNWYAVGGRSFLATLFKDAGADYFLKDDPNSGGVNLNYETVYSQAAEARYWRIVNSFKGKYSYEALKDSDERYADFRAFKDKGVIYCNMHEKPFYESMPVEPEIVLADLIAIFHPDLLPKHQAKYYELLK